MSLARTKDHVRITLDTVAVAVTATRSRLWLLRLGAKAHIARPAALQVTILKKLHRSEDIGM